MDYYYYAIDGAQYGPITLEELKKKHLKKSCLVWTEGMRDWSPASEIEELKDYIIPEPPPLPVSESQRGSTITTSKSKHIEKVEVNYNSDYKESSAIIVGIFLIIFLIVVSYSGIIESSEGYAILTVLLLIIRIAVTIWAGKIAFKLNRNETTWRILGFLTPALALIILGLLRKRSINIPRNSENLTDQESERLKMIAGKLFKQERYVECKLLLDVLIERENNNYNLYKHRAISLYRINKYKDSRSDFERLISSKRHAGVGYYYLGIIAQREKNIDKAVEYWLAAQKSGNKDADRFLNLYHNYKGQYILSFEEVIKKITLSQELKFRFDDDVLLYLKGVDELDRIYANEKHKIFLEGYSFGISIRLKKKQEIANLGISYKEIADIKFIKDIMEIELKLFNNKSLHFKYNYKNDSFKGLSSLCQAVIKANKSDLSASKTIC